MVAYAIENDETQEKQSIEETDRDKYVICPVCGQNLGKKGHTRGHGTRQRPTYAILGATALALD
jgi:ssDNA-binding Zn-finger/Zn-ribbon topoisomerase 1